MASLNSRLCSCASWTAVDWKGESEQSSRVKCFGLFGLTGSVGRRKYKTNSKSWALSHSEFTSNCCFPLRVSPWQQQGVPFYFLPMCFRCTTDVSALLCTNAVSCGVLCPDRKANTTQRWGNGRFGFVCAAASRFEPEVTPRWKLCKGKPEQCEVRGKTKTGSGISRCSKREMAG